jgi:Ala-tRNA(Pro) deacylase
MPARRLEEFLNERHIRYVAIHHSPAYTAQEIAASAHVRGRELAKSVVVRIDGELALAVVPASSRVDFDLLREELGARDVELASEAEFRDRFPGCELGAMPPFGNLYGLRTYVAGPLADDEEIAFNAGSHTELIRMSYEDFARIAQPVVLGFSAKVG